MCSACNVQVNRKIYISERVDIMMGCDPEFFFTKDNKIIGSEKVLPEAGLTVAKDFSGDKSFMNTGVAKFVVDGVQAELNPAPQKCRAWLGNQLSLCFQELQTEVKKQGVSVSFSTSVKLKKEELDALSDKAKLLGCSPSMNNGVEGKIKVNPLTYRHRSAGGHIHLGVYGGSGSAALSETLHDYKRLIPLMDIIVGNTCVLVDRAPENKIRRKVYGKAGEYRTPVYGVEYRTLSNFWLRSYPLMSMVFGLARLAVHILDDSTPQHNYYKQIMEVTNMQTVKKAINDNSIRLAQQNFKKIESILKRSCNPDGEALFNENLLPKFKHFYKKGMDHWFKEDPLDHWANIKEAHSEGGFENFLLKQVTADMKK